MISAFRIVKSKLAATAFEGIGSKLAGGRWNSPGNPVVYTSASQALAMLEMMVHLRAAELLLRYVVFHIQFDEALVEAIPLSHLPKDWQSSVSFGVTRNLGDPWLASLKSPVLRVPSGIVPSEHNYLLNPLHPHFKHIAIDPFAPIKFDKRLIKINPFP